MRRSTLHTIVALALAGLFAAPVAAVEPGGASQETLSGTLSALWIEDPRAGQGREHYELQTGSGTVVPLEFADGGPDGMGGAKVEVTGRRQGRTLHVASSTSSKAFRVRGKATLAPAGAWSAIDATGTTSGATSASTGGTYSTAATVAKSFGVILINFTNLNTQPWTKATVQSAVTGASSSLKAFYEEESKGRMTISASVFGWYTIDAVTTGCDWRTWHTLGANAATAAGVNLSSFTNLMFIWPQTSECGFAGVAYVPGTSSYLNGTLSVQVMTHEVGHNFGLSHSNARDCVVGGARTWLADTASCTTNVYADPFSTMGNNALRHNHASHLGELGWLGASEKVVGSPGNTYTIAPYFGTGPVKLVRIPRGDGTFFDLDVRSPYGSFDNFAAGSPATVGATIRIGLGTASPTSSPKMTELLDTTPATTDLKDAPLLVGKTVTDPVSTISFTTLSADSSGISVRVREGILPSAPGALAATATSTPSVGLSWTAATDNVAVASYAVTRDGAPVATVPAGTTSWTDLGVASGTAYAYEVAAVDTSGNTGPAVTASTTTPVDPAATPTPAPTATPSPDPSATPVPTAPPDPSPPPTPTPTPTPTPNPDGEPPTAPQPLDGTPAITTVSLAWGTATDNTGVVAYKVTRNGTVVATTSGAASGWTDTARSPKTTYAYTVTAMDAAGNASAPTAVEVTTKADTVRPSAPRNFRVVARSGRYVTFAWSRSSDNVRVAKYAVYREGQTRPTKYVLGLKVKMYTRYGAKYFVRAIDTSGNRSYASRHVRGR